MERLFTIRIWTGNVQKSYYHVEESTLSFGTKTSYVEFLDKDGFKHFVFNAVVTVDEEPPKKAEAIPLPSDVL